jgi:hypothetical protein
MCRKCDEAYESKKTQPVFGEGMQYRLSAFGRWQDVEKDQTSFNVYSVSTIQFRKKPKMVATVTYSTNTAEFYSEESLKKAIELNLQDGVEFSVKIEFK